MENNIAMEIDTWWNGFDLVDKILIKDAVNCFCEYGYYSNDEGEEKKEKYIQALMLIV